MNALFSIRSPQRLKRNRTLLSSCLGNRNETLNIQKSKYILFVLMFAKQNLETEIRSLGIFERI